MLLASRQALACAFMLFNGSSGVPKDYAAAAKSFAEVIRAVERDSTHAARSARRFDGG